MGVWVAFSPVFTFSLLETSTVTLCLLGHLLPCLRKEYSQVSCFTTHIAGIATLRSGLTHFLGLLTWLLYASISSSIKWSNHRPFHMG